MPSMRGVQGGSFPNSGAVIRLIGTICRITANGSPTAGGTYPNAPWPSSMRPAITQPSPPSNTTRHRGSPQSPPPRGALPVADVRSMLLYRR